MNEFEEFDPVRTGEFEEFDVNADPDADAEASIESLGGMSDSHDEVTSLLAARAEMESRLMGSSASASAAALSDAEPYAPGNVVGVGIGEKLTGGLPTGQLAVKVLVKEKKPERGVSFEALVPQTVGGVMTDVEETGEIRSQMFTARRRPAPCGVSIGNCLRVMAGTLGCLVKRNNQLFILSNNHVMALVNTSPLNTGIPQPGRLDGGICQQDIIARLTQFVPINSPRVPATWSMRRLRRPLLRSSTGASCAPAACCSPLPPVSHRRCWACRCRRAVARHSTGAVSST